MLIRFTTAILFRQDLSQGLLIYLLAMPCIVQQLRLLKFGCGSILPPTKSCMLYNLRFFSLLFDGVPDGLDTSMISGEVQDLILVRN